MRKLLIFLFLLCACSFATDVRVPGASVYGRLGTALTWASGVNHDFVMDAVSSGAGVCYSFVNNDTGSHTATVNAFVTSDASTTTFASNSGKWQQVVITPTTSGVTTYTFPASAVTQLYVRAPGAFHIDLQVSGGSGTGTVDIIFSQTGTPCGSGTNAAGSTSGWNLVDAPANASPCNTASGVIAGVSGIRHVANCVSVGINTGAATALASNFDIRESGVAGNCASGTIRWSTPSGVPATIGSSDHVAVCGLNISATPGNSLQVCYETTPGTSQSCRTAMSGFDTQ